MVKDIYIHITIIQSTGTLKGRIAIKYCLLNLTGPVTFSGKYRPIETCRITIATLATALERKMTTLT